MKHLLMSAAGIALLAACGAPDAEPTIDTTPEAEAVAISFVEPDIQLPTPDIWGEWGVNLDTMDTDIHPGDNFFRYMNGAWLDTFEIPADRSRYGGFTLLAEKSEHRVRGIIENLAAAQPDPATIEGKVAAVYNAYMDMDTIEAAGLAPVQPYLDRIKAIETREDLASVFAANGFASPVGGWVDIDSKDTDSYIFYVTQAGLGMGDRDYYLKDTEKNLEYRVAYTAMLETLLTEAGYEEAGDAAQSILALETQLAKAHWDRAAGRNRDLTYNKMTMEDILALAGEFPLALWLEEAGLADQTEFVVRQVTPTAEEIEEQGLNDDQIEKLSGGGIAGIFSVAQSYELEAWKAWLTADFLRSKSDVLPSQIDETVFEYYGKTLRGQEEQRERWKRAVSTVEGSVGEAVGKVYAERYFPAENKAAMDDLVANLREAMALNLDDLTWMGEETKIEAEAKLDQFTPKIGFPEKFETYDGLKVGSSAFENEMAVSAWAYEDMISQLGQEIDKTEWFMLPQTVNAYYSPNRNEIVFPAAILQPPFFNLDADPAINYGAIGGVIGHEIGHGFDDQGSRSDGNGVLRNWWTDEDRANFEALTGALVAQYNQFCPLDDGETCVNGALGLGENIGDLGGLSMAYRAYQISLDTDGDGVISEAEQAPVLDGFTGDQRFFVAWAQVWRNKYRDDALRQQLVRGPHSPPRFRVNGIVRNFDEWYEAFGITEEHELYLPPEERIRIW
ncbi:MAG: M13 family metallopeptidase [Pseudomonadota bacterium]